MKTSVEGQQPSGWDAIERERQLDRWLRRICTAAWGITFIVTLGYAWLVGQAVREAMRRQAVGLVTGEAVMAAAMPLVVALGVLALLVACLTTVGVFLRFRTAALGEIQLRLIALESMLTSERAP
jgi:hypothetical protein